MRIVIYKLLKILKKFKKKLQGNFKTPLKLATMKSVLPALFTLTIQVYAHVGQLFSGIYIHSYRLVCRYSVSDAGQSARPETPLPRERCPV